MASSSSSSSLASHRSKYDVFLNFRGEDTRGNFICHLYDALCRKNILTFYDDDGIKRGEEIAQSLPRAIQDSTVAVLVFSKDYASSSWCLDELVEIIELYRIHRQIVMPVFYNIDPSDLRKHSHDVAAAFDKHKQNPKNAHKIKRWKEALTTAASLSGFDSKNFGNDHMLINKIVEDISEKLKHSKTCDDFGHLVGMESRIDEIKKVFTINPSEIRILGIWGMGGVGKTTTAEVIYKMMSHQFDGCCFEYNVRERVERSGSAKKLHEELILNALRENTFGAGPQPFLLKRVGRKKMLIVLDDVKDPLQLEDLIGDPCCFGLGSMVLLTSRDKQVFKGRADFIYEVKLLNEDEALQLFNKKAFDQNYRKDDYVSLSKSIVKYAQGNPLALKVLGSALNGKNQEEWESALTQLSKVQNKEIHHVLQISYDSLNIVEQDLFLDIACFFKPAGLTCVDQDILRKIYKSTGFDITLSVLVDKCLVTSKDPWNLNMHDLLQEMGKEIVRQKAKDNRLWDPQDIYEVFVGNKEAEGVETITLDLSKITEINLNPQVFTKMRKLRFLNFYLDHYFYGKGNLHLSQGLGKGNLHLSQGLDYLPNTLQYLRWDKYPLESLPPNFRPKNLVVLKLSNSNIKQLWKKAKEDSLVSNIKHGIVNGFWRLTSLRLVHNKSITQLPNGTSGFLGLEVLDLRGCSNLNTFPEFSSNMKKLILDKTAIRQITSSSVERLSKLKRLWMEDCKELESLPSNFFSKLTSLEELNLGGCSRLKVLPEILEPMRYMWYLCLRGTAIEKLPSFIDFCDNGRFIQMDNCSKLAFHTRSSENSFSADIIRAETLLLSNCNLRELPEDLSFLSFVDFLDLSGNDFERIPTTFKQLSRLKYLYIYNCKRLLSLPELPSNVKTIFGPRCRSLQEIWTLKQLPLDSTMGYYEFNFEDCFKLDEDECQEVVNGLLRNYTRNQMQETLASFKMVYPGSRIPEWVKYQNMGDSIQIHLPSHWFNHLFLGFAFYLWVDAWLGGTQHDFFDIKWDCYFGDNYDFSSGCFEQIYAGSSDKEHMLVYVDKRFRTRVDREIGFEVDVAFFKFKSKNLIKKCGVIPLYAQIAEDEFCGTFDFPNLGVSKLKRSATALGSFHFMPEKRLKIEEIE